MLGRMIVKLRKSDYSGNCKTTIINEVINEHDYIDQGPIESL